jgi:hypothetical protein
LPCWNVGARSKVLDVRLSGREYLCDEYGITDIANCSRVRTHKVVGSGY